MPENRDPALAGRVRPAAVLRMGLPYASVWIGLHGLHSAWSAVGLYHLGIVATLFADRFRPRAALPDAFRNRLALPTIVACAACGPVLLLLWPVIARADATLGSTLSRYGLSGGSWWLFAGYYATVHPVLEEALWRGRLLSSHTALAPSDIAFAGYHLLVLPLFVTWPWVIVSGIILTATAWAWRVITLHTGGLAVPITAHLVADIGVILAASLLR
jgi:hypothetical protein